jgi:hypothetical protein
MPSGDFPGHFYQQPRYTNDAWPPNFNPYPPPTRDDAAMLAALARIEARLIRVEEQLTRVEGLVAQR